MGEALKPTAIAEALGAYRQFLEQKVCIAPTYGLNSAEAELHPMLKPHQAAAIRWMIEGGRRALFAAFGLGKTIIQLEAIRVCRQRAGGMALIIIPLGVRRSEGRRVGNGWVRTCGSRWEPVHYKKKITLMKS